MNPIDILSLYNQHERIALTLPGCQKVVAPDLVKFVSNREHGSCISYSNIKANELSQRISSEIDYFSQLKLSFQWHSYSTDTPSTLGERLIQQGFIEDNVSCLMVLDLEKAHQDKYCGSASTLCVEVKDKQGIRDAIFVQKKVWARECQIQVSDLIRLKEQSPDQIHIYVVYQDNKPVSSAWLMCNPDSPFGSIWAGSTLKAHRGKGFYSVLLAKRILDAKAKGLRFLTIHATAMSKPIVEKQGFQPIAHATHYRYPLKH